MNDVENSITGPMDPPPLSKEKDSIEILRLWALPGFREEFGTRVDVDIDPKFWGMILANIAKHICRVYLEKGDLPEKKILKNFAIGFFHGWKNMNPWIKYKDEIE